MRTIRCWPQLRRQIEAAIEAEKNPPPPDEGEEDEEDEEDEDGPGGRDEDEL